MSRMSGFRSQIEVVWICTGRGQPPSSPDGTQLPYWTLICAPLRARGQRQAGDGLARPVQREVGGVLRRADGGGVRRRLRIAAARREQDDDDHRQRAGERHEPEREPERAPAEGALALHAVTDGCAGRSAAGITSRSMKKARRASRPTGLDTPLRCGHRVRMSRNLVEIVRRHHAVGAPTALAVLKEAMALRGEITDDDRRLAAERSGLPEAAVHGVSTFYDDLLAPRGRRHIRVCTGTACFAATADAHVDALRDGLGGLALGERSADGAVSLAETVCLGFCHSSPAIRDGDVIDAGPGVVARVLAAGTQAAAEPPPRSALAGGPQLLAPGRDWEGLARAVGRLTPVELLEEVKAATVRGRGGAGFPAGREVGVRARRRRRAEVHRRQRRRGRPRLVHRQAADGGPSQPAHRGHGAGRLRRRCRPRLRPDALGVPALQAAARGRDRAGAARRRARRRACSARTSPSTSRSSRAPAPTSSARRRRCWPACRGCAARSRRGRRFPPSAGCTACRPSSTTSRRWATSRSWRAPARRSTPRSARPARRRAPSSCASTSASRGRASTRSRSGRPLRVLCEDVAGGLIDGHAIKALQIGGPLGGILPAVAARHAV